MFDNPQAVAAIYLVAGSLFLLGLFVGTVTTLARVVFYRIHGKRRPRLLTRDLVVFGGLALSFGLITVVRFLPIPTRAAMTSGNVIWALVSTVPAVMAVAFYCYVELFVIGRAREEP